MKPYLDVFVEKDSGVCLQHRQKVKQLFLLFLEPALCMSNLFIILRHSMHVYAGYDWSVHVVSKAGIS